VLRKLVSVLVLLVPFAAQAATLTIKVENVGAKGGILSLSLYDESAWSKEPDAPLASANVPAVAPETIVTLTDIKPGVYGVKTFQDANRNGKFDQGFLGIPLERFGFSRDARPFLSAPGFDRTRFTIVDGENEIVIHLQ
jgi:uncharacterized protein (DUF2141 family)